VYQSTGEIMSTEVNAGTVNASALEIAPESPIDLPYTPDELGELAVSQMHTAVRTLADRGSDTAAVLFANTDISSAASAVLANTFLLRIANAYERVAAAAERADARESGFEALRRQQLEGNVRLCNIQLRVSDSALAQLENAADAAFSLARFLDLYDPERNTVQELTARLELFRKDVRARAESESEQKS